MITIISSTKSKRLFLCVRDPREAISQHDLDALSGGLGGEIAYLIQSVSNVMSGFLVSFIENWKITLLMMAAGPVLAVVQGIAHKVKVQQFYRLLEIKQDKKQQQQQQQQKTKKTKNKKTLQSRERFELSTPGLKDQCSNH